MSKLNRRDFVKLGASLAGGALVAQTQKQMTARTLENGKSNIILLVFDALSARHLSVYDYARPTTPNLLKFSRRASVYHSHFSGGNFTSAGTASMLTGTYPWTHRAINHRGRIKSELAAGNIFAYLGDDYVKSAFSHNWWANLLLAQMDNWLDEHIPPTSFAFAQNHVLMENLFPNDYSIAYPTYADVLNPDSPDVRPASLLLGLSQIFLDERKRGLDASHYPLGLPNAFYVNFELNDVFGGLASSAQEKASSQKPFFQYFHIFPPHEPYAPHKDFADLFHGRAGYVLKPAHVLVENPESDRELIVQNSIYDSYVANIDHEFGILLDKLEKSGALDNSYLIVTADHGEVFERGMHGHGSALLFDSMLRIPLMVRAPGQAGRVDVYESTSNLDLVPTILHLAGVKAPELEGRILPSLGGAGDSDRSIYSMVALSNSSFRPFQKASMALHKSNYKLIHYLGYGLDQEFELYDLANDRDEQNNLFGKLRDVSIDLKTELLAAVSAANKPYLRFKR